MNGKRRLLLDGSLLWWEAVLLAWCFPVVRHGFGGFFWRRKTRENEMMKVCTSGFAALESYFISSGNASGVVNGRHALMGITNDGGFSLGVKGFFNKIVFMIPE
jgi:hypothetical protein